MGLVLGGTQSLSRSLYGSMIPGGGPPPSFYGFLLRFSPNFSAIWGAFHLRNRQRRYGLGPIRDFCPIVILLVAGAGLLARVNVEEARASRLRWSFENPEG